MWTFVRLDRNNPCCSVIALLSQLHYKRDKTCSVACFRCGCVNVWWCVTGHDYLRATGSRRWRPDLCRYLIGHWRWLPAWCGRWEGGDCSVKAARGCTAHSVQHVGVLHPGIMYGHIRMWTDLWQCTLMVIIYMCCLSAKPGHRDHDPISHSITFPLRPT